MVRLTTALKILSILTTACLLAACTEDNETSSSPPPAVQTSNNAPTTSLNPGNGSTETTPTAEDSSKTEQASSAERPQTASFELMPENVHQNAALIQGKGFSFYVFDGFDFDMATGRLSLTDNSAYYVDIERLPADDDFISLRDSAEQALKSFGNVTDLSGELIEHPLGEAELYLQSSGAEGIRDYIVWMSEAGDRFLFRLRNPKGEEASAFAGPIWISLSTVQGESTE